MLKEFYRNQTTSGVLKEFLFPGHPSAKQHASVQIQLPRTVLVNNTLVFLNELHEAVRSLRAVHTARYILACPNKTLSSKSFLPKNLTVRSGNQLWLLPQLYTHRTRWARFNRHRERFSSPVVFAAGFFFTTTWCLIQLGTDFAKKGLMTKNKADFFPPRCIFKEIEEFTICNSRKTLWNFLVRGGSKKTHGLMLKLLDCTQYFQKNHCLSWKSFIYFLKWRRKKSKVYIYMKKIPWWNSLKTAVHGK